MNEEKEKKQMKEEKEKKQMKENDGRKTRKGISWLKKYKELEKEHLILLGKLEEENAEIEIEEENNTEEHNNTEKHNCPDCKIEVKENSPFCSNCGLKLEWGED